MFRFEEKINSFYKKDISGCAVSAVINTKGQRFSCEAIVKSITNQHERSNGLGGGFAAYGIYPQFADLYALHIMYQDEASARKTEQYLDNYFNVEEQQVIPHSHNTVIREHPFLRRYFVKPYPVGERTPDRIFERLSEDELVIKSTMRINTTVDGAFVFSCGKNMGVFKGVGYPEDIAEFFKLEEYSAYSWIAHGRFPTNSAVWWGGAHPFSLLDWAVVHNGEISSYGINKRFLENFGYNCTLFTDTEVIAYIFDLLIRRHGLSFEMASKVMAPPFWDRIERMPPQDKQLYTTLRATYGGALLNGPFSVIAGFKNGLVALNDRVKLRPLVAARKDDFTYVASEESAIRCVVQDELDEVWSPAGGEPVIVLLADSQTAVPAA